MVLNFYFVRGGVVQYFVKEMVACMRTGTTLTAVYRYTALKDTTASRLYRVKILRSIASCYLQSWRVWLKPCTQP